MPAASAARIDQPWCDLAGLSPQPPSRQAVATFGALAAVGMAPPPVPERFAVARPVGRRPVAGGREVVIVEAVRTPVGRGHEEKGYYKDVHASTLLARTYAELIDRAGARRASLGETSLHADHCIVILNWMLDTNVFMPG